ncbi:MAG: hypothetical protein M1838_001094 [Thelocarpon superellum]|nr:MAG: hypothetical protein M1838_001094 [Thelocarpon superellum]
MPATARQRVAQLLATDAQDHGLPLLPTSHHLVISTRSRVYSWHGHDLSELFHSGSAGIVAAKRANDGSGILAVADSHVVILHDIRKKLERSYRLKRAEGRVNVLEYADDSKSLYFTTSLQNAVQSYSVQQSRLLDPSHIHPSPPTCLALSRASSLLISASASPPTVYVQNLCLCTTPFHLHPAVSTAPVVVIACHPSRTNIFSLAFADGSVGVYDTLRLSSERGPGKRPVGASRDGYGAEVGFMTSVHAPGLTRGQAHARNDSVEGAIDPAAATNISEVSNRSGSITAAEFVPGYRARLVTVGMDGKCMVSDFEKMEKRKGRQICSWHVRSPATSLSILPGSRECSTAGMKSEANPEDCLLAVGRVDGKVLLYSLTGDALAEKTIDPDGGPILDVEWIKGSGEMQRTTEDSPSPREDMMKADQRQIPRRSPKRKSLSSLLAAGREEEEVVFGVLENVEGDHSDYTKKSESTGRSYHTAKQESSPPVPTIWQDVMEASQRNYMNLFSPVKQAKRRDSTAPTTSRAVRRKSATPRRKSTNTRRDSDRLSAISAPQLWNEAETKPAPYTSLRSRTQEAQSQSSTALAPGLLRHASTKEAQTDGTHVALFAPYLQRKSLYPTPNPPSTSQMKSPKVLPAITSTDADAGFNKPRDASIPVRKSSLSSTISKGTASTGMQSRKTVSFEEADGRAEGREPSKGDRIGRRGDTRTKAEQSHDPSASTASRRIHTECSTCTCDRQDSHAPITPHALTPLQSANGQHTDQALNQAVDQAMERVVEKAVDREKGQLPEHVQVQVQLEPDDFRSSIREMRAEMQAMRDELREDLHEEMRLLRDELEARIALALAGDDGGGARVMI